MNKRFILLLGLGIAMALAGVVFSLRTDPFGSGTGGGSDCGQAPADKSPPTPGGGGAFAPGAGTPVPAAPITVDGREQDWQEIEAFVTPAGGALARGMYGCNAVKIARGRREIYVLVRLDRGVGQTFDAARVGRGGRPVSGNVGSLVFRTEGRAFSLHIATGYSVRRRRAPARPVLSPLVRLEVFRHDAQRTLVFSAGSQDRPAVVAFDGTVVEVRLPLAPLGLSRAARMEARFEEM